MLKILLHLSPSLASSEDHTLNAKVQQRSPLDNNSQRRRWVSSDGLILRPWINMNSDIEILSLHQSLSFPAPGRASLPSAGRLGGQWLLLQAGKVSSQIGKVRLEPRTELPPPVEWSLAVWAAHCSAANCVAQWVPPFLHRVFLCQEDKMRSGHF